MVVHGNSLPFSFPLGFEGLSGSHLDPFPGPDLLPEFGATDRSEMRPGRLSRSNRNLRNFLHKITEICCRHNGQPRNGQDFGGFVLEDLYLLHDFLRLWHRQFTLCLGGSRSRLQVQNILYNRLHVVDPYILIPCTFRLYFCGIRDNPLLHCNRFRPHDPLLVDLRNSHQCLRTGTGINAFACN